MPAIVQDLIRQTQVVRKYHYASGNDDRTGVNGALHSSKKMHPVHSKLKVFFLFVLSERSCGTLADLSDLDFICKFLRVIDL